MGRGGARPGAGRKGLSKSEKWRIGAEFARRWRELAKREAVERDEVKPKTKAIRLAHSRAELVPIRLRRTSKDTLAEVKEDIDYLMGGKRGAAIPFTRPYGARSKIVAEVIAYWAKKFGKRISASQVIESWKAFSKVEKSLKNEASLKNP
jgi:hypothetical protein